MQEQEIKITVADGTKELVIRHGQAEPIEQPKLVTLSGDIFSPGNFAENRGTLIDKTTAHVLVNKKDFSITLKTNEQYSNGFVVKGKLEINEHIQALKINTENAFGLKDLQQALKFRRTLFADISEYTQIMTALQNYQAKSQTEVKSIDDRRGNVDNAFRRTSQLEVPLEFNLKMPVFENTQPKEFRVSIQVDIRDAGVSFYLESIELADLIEFTRQEIFTQELARLEGFAIISA